MSSEDFKESLLSTTNVSSTTKPLLSATADDPLDLEHNPFAESHNSGYLSGATSTSPLKSMKSLGQEDSSMLTTEEEGSYQNRDMNSSIREERDNTAASVLSNAFGKASISIMEAKGSADIKVKVVEPVTVGDGMNKHTTYKVQTETSLPQFKESEFSVQRRFNEFLWLYQQLLANNPGVIVPPPPEKHAMGRFDEAFVENRRLLLDRMLKKISVHPILSKDNSFKLFLESDNLQSEMQEKKGKSSFMSKFGDAVSFSGSFTKTTEVDDYFEQKRIYIDQMESQLKSVAKAIDGVIKNREALADCTLEFGESMIGLSTSEINKSAETHLRTFGEAQKKLKDLHEKQAVSDVCFLGNTLDEYIRIMGSVKNALASRTKAYQSWQTAEQTLAKNKINLEKTKLNPKTKADKIAQIESDILEGESRVVATKKEFEDISKLLKEELDMFEKEKVEDVHAALQSYLESMLKNQTQIVSLWDAYLKETEVSANMQ